MALKNRKTLFTTLSKDSAQQLDTLASKTGKPKTRVLDEAVETLYKQKEVEDMEQQHPQGTAITIATNKGGAGKTTSTAAIADILAKKGNRILLIDADPQGNLSKRFGFAPNAFPENYLGELIQDRMDHRDAHRDISYYINPSEGYSNIDIIVSNLRLDGDYSAMNAESIKGTTVFRTIIEDVRALDVYDYILIDTRPSLNNEVGAVLVASDYVMIPVEPTEDAIFGADATIKFMATCRRMNPALKLLGIFMTKVYNRTKSFQEAAPVIRDSWESSVFKTIIPRSQDVDNAGNEGKPVTTMFPNKKITKKYEQLVEEAVNRIHA